MVRSGCEVRLAAVVRIAGSLDFLQQGYLGGSLWLYFMHIATWSFSQSARATNGTLWGVNRGVFASPSWNRICEKKLQKQDKRLLG